jgi:hypothetical protein
LSLWLARVRRDGLHWNFVDALDDTVNLRLGNAGGAAANFLKKHNVYAAVVRIQLVCDFERSVLWTLELESLKIRRLNREDARVGFGHGNPLKQKQQRSNRSLPSRDERSNL